MKKISIFLLIVVVSCSKKSDISSPTTIDHIKSNKLQACNFGITNFNLSKRAVLNDPGKKPRGDTIIPVAGASVLLLEFNGFTVTNTSWNYIPEIVCSSANLTSDAINNIFQRVSEDYRPFNILVTTDVAVYNAANPLKRLRVIVTETWEWYGQTGGVSYVGSFTWGDNTPCFVFSSLLNYNTKQIGEAVSHEAGHTFGLYHQELYDNACNLLSEYNSGTGSGETSWAPIMGNAYYRNMTLWHRGPNFLGCSSIQDDISTIAGVVGFKPDDFTNSLTSALPINHSAEGCINSSTDIDCFYTDILTPSVISLSPFNVGINNEGANLDLELKIYSSSRNLIVVINDPASLSAISSVLSPGRYYLSVETAANLNAGRYGQLGKYFINITP